jgi:hypothetical protein
MKREQGIMRVRKFGDLFPDLAVRHMIHLWIEPRRPRLPVNSYWLIEYYCDEPGCDCRRMVLDVVASRYEGRVFASIHFGWETLGFYRRWAGTRDLGDATPLKRGVLDPSEINCDWANVLLRHIRKEVLSNPKLVGRFKRHYEMAKREQRKQARQQSKLRNE